MRPSKSRSGFSSGPATPPAMPPLGAPGGARLAGLSHRAYAALAGAVLTFLLAGSACCRLGADVDPDAGASSSSDASAKATSPGDTSPGPTGEPTPTAAASAPGEREIAGAAHILVAYRGAELAPPEVTRSKAEAKARAEEVLTKVKADPSAFAELAKQYSDDPTKVAGGAMGNFERYAMPAAFADATFALAVGSLSGIVETPRGFPIIRRTR